MRRILLTAASLFVLSATAWPQGSVGSPAPNFTKATLDHGQITLTQYRGKVVYLFFAGYN